jgi:hypothetical protein
MTVRELAANAGRINTEALLKIRDDMLNRSAYERYYRNSSDWTASALDGVLSGGTGSGRMKPL